MSVSYLTFLKHAEHVTKATSASRPVLQGVYHHPDKSLVVTDSHRLYIAKDAHNSEEGKIIAPKTGEEIEGKYPEVSRLIPTTDPEGTIYIDNVSETLEAAKNLLAAGRVSKAGEKKTPKNKVAVRLYSDDEKKISIKFEGNTMKAEYFMTYAEDVKPGFTIAFSVEYFIQALALFKEAGFMQVEMKLYGSLRPFILTTYQNSLQALILPIRITQ